MPHSLHLLPTLALAALLGGCANFQTLQAFSKDGSAVATAARKDVQVFRTACTELKSELAVLAYARSAPASDAPVPTTCSRVVGATEVVAASLSVDLLVKYHEALDALAGDTGWSLDEELQDLGAQVKKARIDGQALATAADVDRYQGAFSAIAELITSSLRERAARRLLSQDLDWAEALRPLRYWYGGPDGRQASPYASACSIVRTDWLLVRSELLDYARCAAGSQGAGPRCEPLTAGARLAAVDTRIKVAEACASTPARPLPEGALARARLIDSWIEANDELRRNAFDKSASVLKKRLDTLRRQAAALQKATE